MTELKNPQNILILEKGAIRTSFQTRDSIEPTYTKPAVPNSGNTNNSNTVGDSKK